MDRITRDDHAICTTEYSRIVPLENGEVSSSLSPSPGVSRVTQWLLVLLLIGSLSIFGYHLKYSVKPNEMDRELLQFVWVTRLPKFVLTDSQNGLVWNHPVPARCHEQIHLIHLPLDQLAQSPIQPDLFPPAIHRLLSLW